VLIEVDRRFWVMTLRGGGSVGATDALGDLSVGGAWCLLPAGFQVGTVGRLSAVSASPTAIAADHTATEGAKRHHLKRPDGRRRIVDWRQTERPELGVRSKLVGLKRADVWDVSQTAGDPVPELPRPELVARPGAGGPLGRSRRSDQCARVRASARLVRGCDRRRQRADRLPRPRGLDSHGHGRRRPGEDPRPRARTRPAARASGERDLHGPRR
jgi:hypothetical protein